MTERPTGQEELERLDAMLASYTAGDGREHRAVVTAVGLPELYRAGLVGEAQISDLREVWERLTGGGTICSDDRLLDAWLSAFEILASARPDELLEGEYRHLMCEDRSGS